MLEVWWLACRLVCICALVTSCECLRVCVVWRVATFRFGVSLDVVFVCVFVACDLTWLIGFNLCSCVMSCICACYAGFGCFAILFIVGFVSLCVGFVAIVVCNILFDFNALM